MSKLLSDNMQKTLRKAIDENIDGISAIDVTVLAWLYGVATGLEQRVESLEKQLRALDNKFYDYEVVDGELSLSQATPPTVKESFTVDSKFNDEPVGEIQFRGDSVNIAFYDAGTALTIREGTKLYMKKEES